MIGTRCSVSPSRLLRFFAPKGAPSVQIEPFLPPSTALQRGLTGGNARARRALERLSRWYVVDVPDAEAGEWLAEASVSGQIERIEPVTEIETTRAIELDDPSFPIQQNWMFELIDLEAAWDEVRAEDGDVIVAIVDEGFDVAHPDLAPNLWVNPGEIPGNDLDDDGNGEIDDVHGINMTTGDGDQLYLTEFPIGRRHGTLVAGTVGAVANNGIAGAGVAYNPQLMLISVQDDDGVGLDSTYAYRGIAYAALNGASVINCSWRGIWVPPAGRGADRLGALPRGRERRDRGGDGARRFGRGGRRE